MRTNASNNRSWAVVVTAALATTAPLAAAEFVRGDANGDGIVSVADAELIFDYQFRDQTGLTFSCPDAADVDDSETINFLDGSVILDFLFSQYSIPSPHPQAGADPASGGSEDLGCDSYGGGSVIEDPSALVEMSELVVPGGGNGRGYLVLAVTSSAPLAGLSVTVAFEPGRVASAGDAKSLRNGYSSWERLYGDRLTLMSSREPRFGTSEMPPGLSVPTIEVPLCLEQGTPSGTYPVRIISAELVDLDTKRSIHPSVIDGSMQVISSVTAAVDCRKPPPPPVNARYALQGSNAPPGGEAQVDFTIWADALVQGYAYSIDFDEEVVDALRVEELWKRPDGLEFGFKTYEINNENATPGNGGVDEGFLIGVAVFDLHQPIGLPANVEHEMLRFHFRVDPDTEVLATSLRFLDGGKGRGEAVPNMVAANGYSQYTQNDARSFILIGGTVGVLPDVITFVRADSNGDGAVDLSDAQATLGYLFLGEGTVACFDAADANDDGQIDIADPLATLEFLFLGGKGPAKPHPQAGEDPTADGMRCLYRTL